MPNEYSLSAIRKSTHAQIPILAKFYSITCFATKKIEIFQVKFIALPSVEFPGDLKICWTVKYICALPGTC